MTLKDIRYERVFDALTHAKEMVNYHCSNIEALGKMGGNFSHDEEQYNFWKDVIRELEEKYHEKIWGTNDSLD